MDGIKTCIDTEPVVENIDSNSEIDTEDDRNNFLDTLNFINDGMTDVDIVEVGKQDTVNGHHSNTVNNVNFYNVDDRMNVNNVMMLENGASEERVISDTIDDIVHSRKQQAGEDSVVTISEVDGFENETLILEVTSISADESDQIITNYANLESDNQMNEVAVKQQVNTVSNIFNQGETRDSTAKICNVCCETFSHEEDLSEHMNTHAFEGIHKCKYCNEQYIGLRRLREHIHSHKIIVSKQDDVRKITAKRKRKRVVYSNTRKRREQRKIKKATSVPQQTKRTASSTKNKLERRNKVKRTHLCEYCHRVFKTNSHLKSHLPSHTGIKPHKCDKCDKAFIRKDRLRKHFYSCHVTKQNSCETTVTVDMETNESEPSTDVSRLQGNHLAGGFVEDLQCVKGKKMHSCDICRKVFPTPSKLEEHLISHVGDKPHKCDVCDKSFVRKSRLMDHLSSHTGVKAYSCEICQQAFATKDSFKHHFWKHDGIRPFICETCGKSFIRNSHLKEHVRTHSDIKEHECHVCLRRFTVKKSLKLHLMIHTGERPHLCSVCGKSFSLISSLERHELTHNKNKGLICRICKLSFGKSIELKAHQSIHCHTKVKMELCERCGNEFTLKYLKQHQKSCDGVKNYKCRQCGETFFKSALLNAHKNTHYTCNHQCEFCGKHFKDSYHLKRHIKVHE